MSTTALSVESRLTPQQSLLTDEIGNEVYSSHYAERKMSRFVIGAESLAVKPGLCAAEAGALRSSAGSRKT